MTFISPMLADKMPEGMTIKRLMAEKKWVAEEKFDGIRVGVRVTNTEYQAWSRLGNPKVLPQHIADVVVTLPDGYYDGELTVPRGHSWDVSAGNNSDRLELVLFDILEVLGYDIAKHTLDERHKYLEVATEKLKGRQKVVIVDQWGPTDSEGNPFDFEELAQRVWSRGGEGLIIKHLNSTYRPGARSDRWVKIKAVLEATLIVQRFTTGTRQGLLTVAELMDDKGVPCTVKIMNEDWVRRINAEPDHYIGRAMEIEYQVKTADGHYRHPMMKRLAGAE